MDTLQVENALCKRYASLWAMKYKTIKGKPTTYVSNKDPRKHRPWQRAILDDTHPNKAVEKSRQLGLSECGLTEVLHFLIYHDEVKCAYIFPRLQQMQDFAKSRINPVLAAPYFQQFLDTSVSSIAIKKIGNSFLFLRSGWEGAMGEGIDIDMLCSDETDRQSPEALHSYAEGLDSSKYHLLRRWSTPTIPGRGVNSLISQSDDRRYFHTCPHCGERQCLNLDENVIQVKSYDLNGEIPDGTFIIGCKKCKKPLDRWRLGEWVAKRPSVKDIRGYHISQLDAVWISGDDIMRKRANFASKQLFYNYVIGEPYASEGMVVTDQDIKAAIRLSSRITSRNPNYVGIAAGIDWGDISYMAVLGIKASGACDLLNLYKVRDDPKMPLKSVSYFCAILRAYHPNIVVADAGYGSDRNTYGYTQFPDAWYSCYWNTAKSADSKVVFYDQYSEAARGIRVDKTVKTQRTLHDLKGHLIGMPPWDDDIAELTFHVQNTRIMDEEEDGQVYQRATRIGPDHYCCALTYALIGKDKLTNFNVKMNNQFSFDFL